MKYFAISDIHGQYHAFEKMLTHWNSDNEQLVLIGDYIDRGPHSFEVLKLVCKLKKEYGAIATLGNHEDMFLAWLEDKDEESLEHYKNFTGRSTLSSFLSHVPMPKQISYPIVFSGEKIQSLIHEHFSEIVSTLRDMPLFYETSGYIFVHAGIPTFLKDWKNGTVKDYLWVRNQFLYHPHEVDKVVVFGHTNTSLLHQDKNNTSFWIDKTGKKIGIDGGAGNHSFLNGVVFSTPEELPVIYQVKI